MTTRERHCGGSPFAHDLGDSNEFRSRVCDFSSTPLGRPERPTLISKHFAEQRDPLSRAGTAQLAAAEHADPSVQGGRGGTVPELGAGGPAAPVRPADAASRPCKVCRFSARDLLPFHTSASRLTTRGLLLHARRPRASKTSSLAVVLTLCAPSSRQSSRVPKGGRSWLARCWWLATRGWRGYGLS